MKSKVRAMAVPLALVALVIVSLWWDSLDVSLGADQVSKVVFFVLAVGLLYFAIRDAVRARRGDATAPSA